MDAPAIPKTGPGSALLGMKLTARQQALWDLKLSGKTYQEIASILAISRPVVSNTLCIIRKKLGINKPWGFGNGGAGAVELTNPDKAAAVLDAMTEIDPYQKVADAFKACGLPKTVSDSLMRRLRLKYTGALTEVRSLKTGEILDIINKKIHLASFYLDDKAMAEASARDLMLGMSALIEKRQLLRGEPTQIISDVQRKKLNELVPLLIAEGQRRGITIEGQVLTKEVTVESVGTPS